MFFRFKKIAKSIIWSHRIISTHTMTGNSSYFSRPFSVSASFADLKPFQTLDNYKHVGVISYQGKQQGSGIYLHNRVVLTAAHVVPKRFDLTAFQFSFDAKKWNPIKHILRHHRYSYYFPEFPFDIAVIQLENEPQEKLSELKINYQEFETIEGVGVGYPLSYTPRLQTNSLLRIPTPFMRLAVKASCYKSLETPGLLEHRVGYRVKKINGQFHSMERLYDIFDSGISVGMSGGPLFVGKEQTEIAGVIVGSKPRPSFAARIGDDNLYVPLHDKRSWLEDCIATFKNNAKDLEDVRILIKALLNVECFDVLTKHEHMLTFRLVVFSQDELAQLIKILTNLKFNIKVLSYGSKFLECPRIAILGENLIQTKCKLESILTHIKNNPSPSKNESLTYTRELESSGYF